MNPTRIRPGLTAAYGRFRAASGRPRYRNFLARHGVPAETIATEADFAGIPPMTKPDVAEIWPLATQLDDQARTEPSMLVASSGASGRPTYWLRGATSFRVAEAVFDRLFRVAFGTDRRRTLVIVAFAMGTWMGGTYSLLALLGLRARGHAVTVITPGVDLASILDALSTLGPQFEQVIIAGYPAHVRDILDQAPDDALAQDIRLFVGGEPISEQWRDGALGRLGHPDEPDRVVSAYGSSDTAFVGNETALTTLVRRAASDDPALADTLFDRLRPASGWTDGGTAVQPTVVEYDPQICYVETDRDGYLLFTVDATVPLVRYRVNDQGAALDGPRFAGILDAAGYPDLAARVDPDAGYLVMFGRTDVAAIFSGANIYPAQLQSAFDDPAIASLVTGKFVAATVHEPGQRERLQVRAELCRGVEPDDELAERLSTGLVDALLRTNSEYRVLRERRGSVTTPVVVLEPYGASAFRPAPKQRRVASSADDHAAQDQPIDETDHGVG